VAVFTGIFPGGSQPARPGVTNPNDLMLGVGEGGSTGAEWAVCPPAAVLNFSTYSVRRRRRRLLALSGVDGEWGEVAAGGEEDQMCL
jgi:hypothetical protein